MATAALVLAPPPEVLPPHATTMSTVAMANDRAKAVRVIRLPPCLSSTKNGSQIARWTERDRANAIGNRMLGQGLPTSVLWLVCDRGRTNAGHSRVGDVGRCRGQDIARGRFWRPGCADWPRADSAVRTSTALENVPAWGRDFVRLVGQPRRMVWRQPRRADLRNGHSCRHRYASCRAWSQEAGVL